MQALNESALREEVCRVGASLFARGYVHSTAGNISVRLENGDFLITPTDACLGHVDPAQLAKLGADGQHLSGDAPSKTIPLHRKIYEADSQARCVIHTHSTHLVAASLLHGVGAAEFMVPITPYFVMKVGRVPLIPYHRPGDPAVGELVAQRISEARSAGGTLRAVMLERLGPNVWDRTPAHASAVLEELEETARLWLLTRAAPLASGEIDELRRTFGAVW